MKKNFSSAIIVTITLAFVSGFIPQQANAFDFQSTFSSVTSTIQQQFRKIYLALPGDKSAEAVLEQTSNAMQSVSTVEYQTKIDAKLQQESNQLANLKVSIEGPAVIEDIYQPSSMQQDLHVNAELSMEGTTLSTDADVKVDGKTVYIKANQIPAIPFLQVSQFKDQWVQFDSNPELGSESLLLKTDEQAFEDESALPYDKLTAEQRAQLQALYSDFIQDSELSPAKGETIDGKKVFVITMTFSGDDLALLARKSAEISSSLSAEDLQNLEDSQKGLRQLEDVTATIMVDRSTYYLHKVVVPLVIDIPKEAESGAFIGQVLPIDNVENADTLILDIEMMFTDYNQPVEFTLPAEVSNASDLFTKVMGESSLPVGIGNQAVSPVSSESVPSELLETLSDQDKALLEQYGIDIKSLQ